MASHFFYFSIAALLLLLTDQPASACHSGGSRKRTVEAVTNDKQKHHEFTTVTGGTGRTETTGSITGGTETTGSVTGGTESTIRPVTDAVCDKNEMRRQCEDWSTHNRGAKTKFSEENGKCYVFFNGTQLHFYRAKRVCQSGEDQQGRRVTPDGWNPTGHLINRTDPVAKDYLKRIVSEVTTSNCTDEVLLWAGPSDYATQCCILYDLCRDEKVPNSHCDKLHYYACEWTHPDVNDDCATR